MTKEGGENCEEIKGQSDGNKKCNLFINPLCDYFVRYLFVRTKFD